MLSLTNLEDLLILDANGHQRQQMIEVLNEAICHLSYAVRQPHKAEEHASLECQYKSCLAAIQVIESVWLLRHQNVASSHSF